MELATFAAGCFWGVQLKFSQIPGVKETIVGYTGGHTEFPNYDKVCGGDTGHAESIQIKFDPDVISYIDLLDIFWSIHNPTTLNRQGPDIGTQYRSAIFYHDQEQKQQAIESRDELQDSEMYTLPITTEITATSTFYPAEEYHQNYLVKNGVSHC